MSERLQQYSPEQKPNPEYITTIHEGEGQVGFFLGIQHSHEPGNVTDKLIRSNFQNFLEQTHPEDGVVVLEGGMRTPVECDPFNESELDDVMLHNGEQVFMASLAKAHGIECVSGDSLELEEMHQAAAKYPELAQYIPIYLLMRFSPQWMREFDNGTRTEDELYIQAVDSMQKKGEILTQAPDSVFTPEKFLWPNLMTTYEELFDKPFDFIDDGDEHWERSMKFQTASHTLEEEARQRELAEKYPIIKLTQVVSEERDKIIGDTYQRLWDEGKSIFTAYGVAHIKTLDDKIRSL